jgi:hypothetical protein
VHVGFSLKSLTEAGLGLYNLDEGWCKQRPHFLPLPTPQTSFHEPADAGTSTNLSAGFLFVAVRRCNAELPLPTQKELVWINSRKLSAMSANRLLNKALTFIRLQSAAATQCSFAKAVMTPVTMVGAALTKKLLLSTAKRTALSFQKGMQKAFFQESFNGLITVINRPSKCLVSVFEKCHAFKPKELRPFGNPKIKTVPSFNSTEPVAEEAKVNEDAPGFDFFCFHYAALPSDCWSGFLLPENFIESDLILPVG